MNRKKYLKILWPRDFSKIKETSNHESGRSVDPGKEKYKKPTNKQNTPRLISIADY